MFKDLNAVSEWFFVYLAGYFVFLELLPTYLSMHSSLRIISSTDYDTDKESQGSRASLRLDKKYLKNLEQVTEKTVLMDGDYKLGAIYRGVLDGKEICLREIKFERLTRYDVENIKKDLQEIQSKNK